MQGSAENAEITLQLRYDTQVMCYYTATEDILHYSPDVRATLTQLHRRSAVAVSETESIDVEQMIATSPLPVVESAIHTRPSQSEGVVLSYLPDNATFTVLAGPTDHDDRTWYKIDHLGLVGWVLARTTE